MSIAVKSKPCLSVIPAWAAEHNQATIFIAIRRYSDVGTKHQNHNIKGKLIWNDENGLNETQYRAFSKEYQDIFKYENIKSFLDFHNYETNKKYEAINQEEEMTSYIKEKFRNSLYDELKYNDVFIIDIKNEEIEHFGVKVDFLSIKND